MYGMFIVDPYSFINLLYPQKTNKGQTIVLAINSLDLFSESFGVYGNNYTYKSLLVHTTCWVECSLSPHVNIFLRWTCVFPTSHLEVGGGHSLIGLKNSSEDF